MHQSRAADAELPVAYRCFDELDEGVAILNPDGTVAWLNEPLRDMLVIGSKECLGISTDYFLSQYLAPAMSDNVCTAQVRSILQEQEDVSELSCRMRPGRRGHRWFAFSSRRLTRQPYAGMMLIRFRDITERKLAEEALRESEGRYRTLVETLHEGIVVLDRGASITFANPRMAEMIGYSVEEAIGKPIYLFIDSKSAGIVRYNIERRELGFHDIYELELRRRDGNRLYVSIQASPLTDRQGNYIGSLAGVADITERKLAEEALREREHRFRALIEKTSDIILILDPQGTIVFASPPIKSLDGMSPDLIVGRSAFEMMQQKDVPKAMKLFTSLMKQPGSSAPIEVQFRGSRGLHTVEAVVTNLLNDPSVRGFVVNARDITARKRAEEDRAALHRQLEAAHREANLYLDILTHDIRNTENVSSLYADLLTDIVKGEAAGYVEKLRRSIQKSIAILGNVSTIRRIHRGAPELKLVDLEAVIRAETDHFPESNILYEGAPRLVRADDFLCEVFANLIGNAVKFGGPGVHIFIRTERQEDGTVLVTVEDTGPGVPDDQKTEIFRRYEKRQRGVGEGLGLYLVQILVERYGGRIWAEDRVPGRPEEGTAFRFTLQEAEEPCPNNL